MTKTLVLTGTATTDQSQTYIHLPFEVPPGTARIAAAYEYSGQVGSDPRLTDGNTIDIGIFDPRGTAFMTEGFRGWSGSARSEFYITPTEATPGYLAGSIQPGQWAICLGLYKIAPQGCEYRVTITLTPGESAEITPELLPVRTATGQIKTDGWYCGEMHCHTYHSDGDSDPLDVVRRAEALGLDFLAITDHNVLSHLARLNQVETPLILIPGLEVTTYKGHWNVWGDFGWIDFRIEDEAHMAQAVEAAAQRGYVTSCNHPRPYGPDWMYKSVNHFNCIEVWNGPWPLFNSISLDLWEDHLRAGRRYTAVGGSDSHFLKQEHVAKLAHPTLWVYCDGEPSAPAILAAIRAGHVMISDHPQGPRLTIQTQGAIMGDTITRPPDGQLTLQAHVLNGANCQFEVVIASGSIYSVPIKHNDVSLEIPVTVADSPYVRAQLIEHSQVEVLARTLTNPIYLR